MRRFGLTTAACAFALAVPATGSAAVLGIPEREDARARLTYCRSGVDPLGRSLSVDSVMRSLRVGDRMHMRFDLFQRVPGARLFRRLIGPGLGVWNAATPGVLRFRFRKPIQNLPAPASYYVRVLYRWRDESDETFARTSRRTVLCRQPDLRADLRVTYVGAARPLGPTMSTYPAIVYNAGRATSGDFDAALTIGNQPQSPTTVASLSPGERRTVQLAGARCRSGAAGSIQLDPDNRVDESDERNNVRSFTCA